MSQIWPEHWNRKHSNSQDFCLCKLPSEDAYSYWAFTIMVLFYVFVRNCLITRNRTPSSWLEQKEFIDLLEGHWEYIIKFNPRVPITWEERFPSCQLSLGLHGFPPLPLSQHGYHPSSCLCTNRISSPINLHGSNMAGRLTPTWQNPINPVPTVH